MTMKITLYHSPGACSMATYISLLEAGAEFDVKIISLKKSEQMSPEYAAINPKKKVPFLVVDDQGLTENVAIQTWIAETYPGANLMPADSWDHKQAISYMGWFGSGIHPHITRHFKPGKFCADESAHADIKAKSKAMYMEQLALVDSKLEGRALNEGFDLSGMKNATAHNELMRTRENVKKVLAHTDS